MRPRGGARTVPILGVRQGDGTYVSSLASDSLVEALSFIVAFHHAASVLQRLEVRRILEPAACARAALLAEPDDIAELEETLDRATSESSVDDLVQADLEFHRAIAQCSRNTVLASLTVHVAGVEEWLQDALA